MSLNYDARGCKNLKFPLEDENDKVLLDVIVFGCIHTGIGNITEKTAPEYFARMSLFEDAFGAFRNRGEEEVKLSPQEVVKFIGLKTNVFPTASRAKWLQRFTVDLDERVREFNNEVTRSQENAESS